MKTSAVRKPLRRADNGVFGEAPKVAKTSTVDVTSLDDESKELLNYVKEVLDQRGSSKSFAGMMRLVRTFDDNHNGILDEGEFVQLLEVLLNKPSSQVNVKTVNNIGIGAGSTRQLRVAHNAALRAGVVPVDKPDDDRVKVPVKRLKSLFHALDKDGSGNLSAEEVMMMLRPSMAPKRMELVKLAFDLLDTDGSGVVEVEEIASKYDFKHHPDVLTGAITTAEALRQFMTTWWDADSDGRITLTEFVGYYQKLSVTIDSDDYFELMIRNAWKLSGGTAQSACTTSVRAIVYYFDGSEGIVEVQNSLGLRKGDSVELVKRLKRQGVAQLRHAEIAGVRADQ